LDPAAPQRTIVLLTGDERSRTGAQAIFSVVARSGGALGAVSRPFALKAVSLLFEPGYRLFARYRGKLARFFPDPPEENL
jgi:hypothetical protein